MNSTEHLKGHEGLYTKYVSLISGGLESPSLLCQQFLAIGFPPIPLCQSLPAFTQLPSLPRPNLSNILINLNKFLLSLVIFFLLFAFPTCTHPHLLQEVVYYAPCPVKGRQRRRRLKNKAGQGARTLCTLLSAHIRSG